MTATRLTPRSPTCFTKIHYGAMPIGTVIGTAGFWQALGRRGELRGVFASQRAAVMAVRSVVTGL
jgi:hypothetical protein